MGRGTNGPKVQNVQLLVHLQLPTRRSFTMGLFDKDRAFGRRLDAEFKVGEAFVLYAIEPDEEPLTVPSTGEVVDRARLDVQHLDLRTMAAIGPRIVVKSIAAPIVALAAQEADEGELPAVVALERVAVREYENEATVLRFIAPYTAGREVAEG